MPRLLTFLSAQAPARLDGEPWVAVRVDVSEDRTTWTVHDQVLLDPIDDDPSDPASRHITVLLVEGSGGYADWARLVWIDAADNESEASQPISTGPWPFRPTIADVSERIMARTKDRGGNEDGVFNDDTRPTGAQVESLISEACGELADDVGPVPGRYIGDARNVTALRVAALVERSFIPEQADDTRATLYQTLRIDAETQLTNLRQNVEANTFSSKGFL